MPVTFLTNEDKAILDQNITTLSEEIGNKQPIGDYALASDIPEVPESADPDMYLTTDKDGNRAWNQIVGKNLEGQTVYPTSDSTGVVASEGATIIGDLRERTYNDYGLPNAGNIAAGQYAHAEGQGTTASGDYSHAEGYDTTASGNGSHAEGRYTVASGILSHAEGFATTTSGIYSHAEGQSTTASGDFSHTEGYDTMASSEYQHAEGKFNIEDTEGKYAHIIGNGTAKDARSNAHTLDWDGTAWFANTIKVGGTGQDDETAEEVALKSDIPEIPEVPESTDPDMYLTTDNDGNRTWEKKLAYVRKEEQLAYEVELTGSPMEIIEQLISFNAGDVAKITVNGVVHETTIFMLDNGSLGLGTNEISIISHGLGNESNVINTYGITGPISISVITDKYYTIDPNFMPFGARSGAGTYSVILNPHSMSVADGILSVSANYGQSTGSGAFAANGAIAHGGASFACGGGTADADNSFASGLSIAKGACQNSSGKYNIEDVEGKYVHIVGNGSRQYVDGANVTTPSNAHTLAWDGTAWFANTVKVGGTGQDDETAEEVALKSDVTALAEEIDDLDAIRYDTAQTLTDAQKMQARENIGAVSLELVWENASPESGFAEQTVTLDLSRAKAIFVQAQNNVNGGGYLLSYGPFPKDETVIIERNVETYVYTRKFTPTDTGVAFLNSNQGANYLVPLKIWAIFE